MASPYSLPQTDNNPNRAAELEAARRFYIWDMTYGVPVSKQLNNAVDASGPGWIRALAATAVDIRQNILAYGAKTQRKYSVALPPSIYDSKGMADWALTLARTGTVNSGVAAFFLPDVGYGVPNGVATKIDDYKELFATQQPPDIINRYDTDEGFAYTFVSGPNPVMLRRLNSIPQNFPINNGHFQKAPDLAGDSLEAALAENRVYYVDYAINAKLSPGKHGEQTKYAYAPLVAFAVTKRGELRPFAIQCEQDPVRNQIYTPDLGWSWKIARNCVLASHNTMHEVLVHLGWTHLLMEPILVATRRQLHTTHPVYALLSHHFEGTMLINNGATHNLIQKGAAVDALIGASMDSVYPYLAENRFAYSFTGNYLPTRLAEHKTDDPNFLPNYPYRDDALLVWKAINDFTHNFVYSVYQDDNTLRQDKEIQAWAAEIAAPKEYGGAVKDFGRTPGRFDSRDDLASVLGMTIYTASAQHAAVNFAQKTDMTFVPANPLAGYTPAPQGTSHTEADYLAHLPPLEVAVTGVEMLTLLGSIYYTKLGDYTSNLGMVNFTTGDLRAQVDKFQAALLTIEDTITQRNKTRKWPYIHLLPSRIPQGINI